MPSSRTRGDAARRHALLRRADPDRGRLPRRRPRSLVVDRSWSQAAAQSSSRMTDRRARDEAFPSRTIVTRIGTKHSVLARGPRDSPSPPQALGRRSSGGAPASSSRRYGPEPRPLLRRRRARRIPVIATTSLPRTAGCSTPPRSRRFSPVAHPHGASRGAAAAAASSVQNGLVEIGSGDGPSTSDREGA